MKGLKERMQSLLGRLARKDSYGFFAAPVDTSLVRILCLRCLLCSIQLRHGRQQSILCIPPLMWPCKR